MKMGRDAACSATGTSTQGSGKTVMHVLLPTTQLPTPLLSPFARASPPALQGSKKAKAPSNTLTERCTQACTRMAAAMVLAHSSSRTAPNTLGNIATTACALTEPPSLPSKQRACPNIFCAGTAGALSNTAMAACTQGSSSTACSTAAARCCILTGAEKTASSKMMYLLCQRFLPQKVKCITLLVKSPSHAFTHLPPRNLFRRLRACASMTRFVFIVRPPRRWQGTTTLQPTLSTAAQTCRRHRARARRRLGSQAQAALALRT